MENMNNGLTNVEVKTTPAPIGAEPSFGDFAKKVLVASILFKVVDATTKGIYGLARKGVNKSIERRHTRLKKKSKTFKEEPNENNED